MGPQPLGRQENPELEQARAKISQLEMLLKQGRSLLQDLRTQVVDARKERDELRVVVADVRADRDRLSFELRSTEMRRAALEEKLGAATRDVERLRADAEHARALARELISIYEDPHP